MSHISTIKTEITDMESLAKACHDCGLILQPNQKTFKAYVGTQRPCEHAIVHATLPDAYQVGLKREGVNGSGQPVYELLMDHWRGGKGMTEALGGTNACKLLSRYAYHRR